MTGFRQDKSLSERLRFVEENTSILAPPHVGEIRLHLADEVHDLWHRTEAELEAIGLPPPFWAFAWAGGQGLARHVLDHPKLVEGRAVVDLATGSGLVAIAAAMGGASRVTALDIDPYCEAALSLNAGLNAVDIEYHGIDLLAPDSGDLPETDVLLAGDVFYDREMSARVWPLLRDVAAKGATVVLGDPGRAYLPRKGLLLLAEYEVPVSRVLEDSEVKRTRVWQVI